MAISRNSPHLVGTFQNLLRVAFQVTSQSTKEYNCVAWAMGEHEIWWDPAQGYYWPQEVPRGYSIEIFKALFRSLGYMECESFAVEDGKQKIAIYGRQGRFSHVARQLPDGWWTSKLGEWEDIRHEKLDGLTGEWYGEVVCIMSRILGADSRAEARAGTSDSSVAG